VDADYDRISVAKIASTAGCSVGAFYGRFPSKYAYLKALIDSTFDFASAVAERELDPRRWSDAPNTEVVQQIVRHVVTTMRDETAGVARSALKRATADSTVFKPLLSYRSKVTEQAISLLERRMPKSSEPHVAIRTVMQIIHATVADSLLHNQGPLDTKTPLMIAELSAFARRRLNIGKIS
jgi:AcrR family transcriptional regulator